MLKFLLIICTSLILILNFKYRSLKNPFKLYMIFGKKGSGKSTYLCKIANQYLKKGYHVYTNMTDCTLKNVRIIDPDNLGKYIPEPKSCILLDECGILFDNRNYKNFRPEVRDFFKLQRHYKTVVFLASQSFDVDKKLRDLTDRMFLINSLCSWLTLIRPINKKIALVEASAMGESRIADNLKFTFFTQWRFMFVPKYIKYFQSFIAPKKPYLEYIENL